MIGPIPYIGGKNRLAAQIITLFPEHTTYVEPFAGGAQVFFRKEPSKVEVLNDLDYEIVNFYRRGSEDNRFDRVGTAYELNEKLTRSRPRRIVKDGLNAMLNALGLGDSLKIFAHKPNDE